jgi:hypothetical protein
VEAVVAVEPFADLGRLIGIAVLRPAAHDLLNADDVGLGHRIGDAPDIVLSVLTDSVMDVVGAENHISI